MITKNSKATTWGETGMSSPCIVLSSLKTIPKITVSGIGERHIAPRIRAFAPVTIFSFLIPNFPVTRE